MLEPKYQQVVSKIFCNQLGHRIIEVYVDDMIVNERRIEANPDLRETIGTLRRFHMMLNPNKCVFGVKGESASNF